MSGQDHHAVVERQVLVVERVVHVPGQLAGGFDPHQIGTPGIADEQGVAGERHPGVFGAGLIHHQQGDALRRMAGGEAHPQFDVAQRERIAALEWMMRKSCLSGLVHVDFGPGARRQFGVPGYMVGMEMRLDNVGDGHAAFGCGVQILLYIAVGVNNRRDPCAFAPDQIGGAAQPIDKKLL